MQPSSLKIPYSVMTLSLAESSDQVEVLNLFDLQLHQAPAVVLRLHGENVGEEERQLISLFGIVKPHCVNHRTRSRNLRKAGERCSPQSAGTWCHPSAAVPTTGPPPCITGPAARR